MFTHEVTNQVPPLYGHDLTASDPALAAALADHGGIDTELAELGARAGSAEIAEAARLANLHPPVLHTHDGNGHRIDVVEYHPAWHLLMTAAVAAGLHAAPWEADRRGSAGGGSAGDGTAEGGGTAQDGSTPKDGDTPPASPAEAGARAEDPKLTDPLPVPVHLRRAAKFYVWTQAEAGHLCPISMTYAAVPTLRHAPDLAKQYEPGLESRAYDFGLRPASVKSGLLAGMSMTEKQGGSDVRAGTTTAEPAGDVYRVTGHKWFTSAPMNDIFLTLAQAPGGLTCFLLPRVLPDGHLNAISLMRLKDKLGNRSNASAEIEYDGAVGWRIGDEGRGVATILDMVTMTRLDCVLGSAGGIRAALSQAAHHAAHRKAFGHLLIDSPAMTAVLADLAVESWAATLTGLRLAQAVDAGETELLRIALPAAKFWVCKRAVPATAEALECLGGNGYVEESVMPRLFRESPLNGIWEGSGNVTALDTLRAIERSPESVEALRAELADAAGVQPIFDAAVHRLDRLLADPNPLHARAIASWTARLVGAALLIRSAPTAVADLYCTTRLGDAGDRVFGDLPSGYPLRDIVSAATPKPSARAGG